MYKMFQLRNAFLERLTPSSVSARAALLLIQQMRRTCNQIDMSKRLYQSVISNSVQNMRERGGGSKFW